MGIDQIIQLGGTGATLAVLVWMVKYFISATDRKDTLIAKLNADFLLIMTNHMSHEEKAFEQLTHSIKELANRR